MAPNKLVQDVLEVLDAIDPRWAQDIKKPRVRELLALVSMQALLDPDFREAIIDEAVLLAQSSDPSERVKAYILLTPFHENDPKAVAAFDELAKNCSDLFKPEPQKNPVLVGCGCLAVLLGAGLVVVCCGGLLPTIAPQHPSPPASQIATADNLPTPASPSVSPEPLSDHSATGNPVLDPAAGEVEAEPQLGSEAENSTESLDPEAIRSAEVDTTPDHPGESESNPQPPNTHEDAGQEPRLWTDAGGRFKVEAKFRGCRYGVVRLEKHNGEIVEVLLSQLSQADQNWVEPHRTMETAEPGVREWSDRTHQFVREASFQGNDRGVVTLITPHGDTIKVPFEELSLTDQEYVKQLSKEIGSPHPTPDKLSATGEQALFAQLDEISFHFDSFYGPSTAIKPIVERAATQAAKRAQLEVSDVAPAVMHLELKTESGSETRVTLTGVLRYSRDDGESVVLWQHERLIGTASTQLWHSLPAVGSLIRKDVQEFFNEFIRDYREAQSEADVDRE
jgi:hypothetical protein